MNTHTETKHTPGPWVVGGPYPGVSVCRIFSGPTETDPGCMEPVCVIDSRTHGKVNPQSLADARLIASAPDLLEALQNCYAFMTDHVTQEWLNRSGYDTDKYGCAVISAKAAIAKATEGAQ